MIRHWTITRVFAVNLESLAAKYRLERDEGCAKCRQFQQQKDVSNMKVVELGQQVNQQQTELSRLKSESATSITKTAPRATRLKSDKNYMAAVVISKSTKTK